MQSLRLRVDNLVPDERNSAKEEEVKLSVEDSLAECSVTAALE